MTAWILGNMLPGAKWPSAMYRFASATVIWSRSTWFGLPKLRLTFSTAVGMRNRSAPMLCASSDEA